MPRQSSESRKRGGGLAPATVVLVSVIAPLVAAAVDVLTLRSVQDRLDMAVEGGAVAAARAWSAGSSPERQGAAVRATAERFVRANLPDSCPVRVEAQVGIRHEAGLRRRVVEVSAEAVVPLSLLRVFGPSQSMVSAQGRASRRDLRTVVAVDRNAAALLQAAAPDLTDRLGARAVTFRDRLSEGLRGARRALAAEPAPGALDVIVVLAAGDAHRASDWNAAWDAARRIRGDDTLDPLVYVIASGAPDAMLMKMVANARDPGNPAFDVSRPAGLYTRVRTEDDLGAAFAAVAAGIARATQ